MTPTFYKSIGLTVLAVTLALALPARAETVSNQLTSSSTSSPRQEIRERMDKMRSEHEDLEKARDALMEKCVNVTKEQAEVCKQEKKALHERAEKLHEQNKAMHDKRMEMHKKHHEEMEKRRSEHKQDRDENREEHKKHRMPPSDKTPDSTDK